MFNHVVVVFINYNRSDLTLQAVDHIRQLYPDLGVVVVDNGSCAADQVLLNAKLPENVTLVLSERNTGYSGGTNLGMQAVQSADIQYLWLLNNDAFPAAGALEGLLVAQAEHGPALTGSTIVTEGKPPYIGGRIDWWRGTTYGVASPPLDYVTAASLLLPVETVRMLGPWDERYFLYVEDIEYGVRAFKAGIPIINVPDSIVHHLKGQTTGGSSNPVNQYYAARNRLLLFSTYAGPVHNGIIHVRYAWQLVTSWLKSRFKAKYRLKHRIAWLAYTDWFQQRFGFCPHRFETVYVKRSPQS